MSFEIFLTKKAIKGYNKMPKSQQNIFEILVKDLENLGPVLPKWSNYSKLEKNKHHCHLSHNWVTCWKYEKKTITIEVYYASSRGNAPY